MALAFTVELESFPCNPVTALWGVCLGSPSWGREEAVGTSVFTACLKSSAGAYETAASLQHCDSALECSSHCNANVSASGCFCACAFTCVLVYLSLPRLTNTQITNTALIEFAEAVKVEETVSRIIVDIYCVFYPEGPFTAWQWH